MAKITSIKLNNKAFTPQATNSLLSKLSKQTTQVNETITLAVSVAVAHAGIHSNLTPLITIFDQFRLQSGKLNKQGRLIKAYVQAYYKAVDFDNVDRPAFKLVKTPVEGEEKGKTALKPISQTSRLYFLTGNKGENGKPERASLATDYAGLPSYGEWLANETQTEAKPTPKATVSSVKRRITALADLLNDFHGDVEPDAFKEIQDAAKAIFAQVQSMTVKTNVDVEQVALQGATVDADPKADNLTNEPIGGKKGFKVHASAGRKVA